MFLKNTPNRFRIMFVIAALLVLFSLLFGRMLMLQVLDFEGGVGFLQSQGDARTLRKEVMPAYRGMIVDRNGQPLAVSTPVVSVYANPKKLDANDPKLAELARKIGSTEKALKARLKRYRNKGFMYLERHLSPAEASEIFALGIKGVHGQNEYQRFFPAAEVTSHLIGYTDIENQGQEGLEYTYNDWLSGSEGSKLVVKDLFQRTIKNVRQITEPKQGKDLQLSIDLRLQYIAYRALKSAVKKHRADGGSVVVLDAKTSEILAMVNQPAFNPNNRSRIDIQTVRNRALTDTFEPGSTVKPITVLAALESGKFNAHSKINTNPGYIKVARKTLLDPVNYGVIDVAKVIKKSSQVGISKIALQLEPDKLHEMFYRLGLGQYAGTGFPGESTGYLPNHGQGKPLEQAAFSFGAGISVTALQLAEAYTVLANGGVKHSVSLLKREQQPEGLQVVEPNIVRDVQAMLAGVTSKGGTGTKANTRYYSVSGKTGTSHKVGRGGYLAGHYMSLFAGFAPNDNPRLVAVIMVDDPKGKEYYGGEVAAPVFAEIMSNSLRTLNVAPDKAPEMPMAISMRGGR